MTFMKGVGQEQDSKFRLSRLNMFLFDLQQARRFAQYILRRKWPKVIDPQSRLGLVREAFNTSLIISYCRPFHGSREGQGLPDARLNLDLVELNDAERAFHQKVLDKRDQAYAHSDAIAHEIEGWDYSGSMVQFYNLIYPLTDDEIRMLAAMIGKWIKHLDEQRAMLKKSNLVQNRER